MACAAQAETIRVGQMLAPGQALYSDDRMYVMVMQADDGHLVIYRDFFDKKPIWWTGKPGGAGSWAVFQGDRNFVVYKAGAGIPSNAAWATNTGGANDPGAYITLRNNGALYVHSSTGKIYWSSPVDPMFKHTSCPVGAPQNSYPICTRPNTSNQRTSWQPACTWERAEEILTHTINAGAVMGPCE